jgi:hypothetical protein
MLGSTYKQDDDDDDEEEEEEEEMEKQCTELFASPANLS